MINVEGLKDFADIFKDMYSDTMSVFVMLITSMIQGRTFGGDYVPCIHSACQGESYCTRLSRSLWLCRVRYPFHPRVTAVARKKIPVILPKVQVAGYS